MLPEGDIPLYKPSDLVLPQVCGSLEAWHPKAAAGQKKEGRLCSSTLSACPDTRLISQGGDECQNHSSAISETEVGQGKKGGVVGGACDWQETQFLPQKVFVVCN